MSTRGDTLNSIGEQLKRLRLAHGMSLEELATALGGIITKQAISKYELGKSEPPLTVLAKLAAVFHVKVSHFWLEPEYEVELIAYRKKSKLPRKEQVRVEHLMKQTLESRLSLQSMLQPGYSCDVPVQEFPVRDLEDAEKAAKQLREKWNLGTAPITNVTELLENRCIHVIELEGTKDFDGLSAVATRKVARKKKTIGAAVATRRNVPGERMRLNLTHELGHVVLKPAKGVDPEKAAFRFGSAFLVPAEELYQQVGKRRTHIDTSELLLLKKKFGVSIQALVHRLQDLNVINESTAKHWWIHINRAGWKHNEPLEMGPEQPSWLQQNVARAVVEGLITSEHGQELLQQEVDTAPHTPLMQRKAFMKLPLEERLRVLSQQAEKMAEYYAANSDWKDLQGGDFIDYPPS